MPRRRHIQAFFSALSGKRNQPVDQVLLVTIFVLLLFGLIMITSIGVPKSIRLSAPDMLYPNCQSDEVDCYLVLKNHAIRLALGLMAFMIFMKVNYKF